VTELIENSLEGLLGLQVTELITNDLEVLVGGYS
jgi:hypothetical protein